jgi:hypothetical protein
MWKRRQQSNPKEGTMFDRKTLLAAALTIAAGSLFAGQAQAGASASAASKNTHNVQTASVQHARHHGQSQTAGVEITQFTSSSATGSVRH